MSENFADRLLAAIEKKGSPVCVGLDPVFDRLPSALQKTVADEVEETESNKYLKLEDALKERVIGQGEAIGAIAHAVRRSRAGINGSGARNIISRLTSLILME